MREEERKRGAKLGDTLCRKEEARETRSIQREERKSSLRRRAGV